MKNKILDNEMPADIGLAPLTSDSARQRWEMFHRAIAYAKQSNIDALHDDDSGHHEAESNTPFLSVVR